MSHVRRYLELWEIQSRYGALSVPCGRAVYSIKWGGQGEPQWEGKMTLELKGTERVSHLEKEAFVQRL